MVCREYACNPNRCISSPFGSCARVRSHHIRSTNSPMKFRQGRRVNLEGQSTNDTPLEKVGIVNINVQGKRDSGELSLAPVEK